MKVWLTKDALHPKRGIVEAETDKRRDAEFDAILGNETVWVSVKGRYHGKGSWFKVREEAIKKAEQMRVKQIAKLKAELHRLENLKFT